MVFFQPWRVGRDGSVEDRYEERPGHLYWVGYYLKQEGSVIEFSRPWGNGRWGDGYAFSEKLPGVLKQLGARLPSQN